MSTSVSEYSEQNQSPLFSVIPPEIRSEIFIFALSSYEDPTRPYGKETHWTRPDHAAPQHTSTDLLYTCKRIYHETWFMPLKVAIHTFYLTSTQRAPGPRVPVGLEQCLRRIYQNHKSQKVEIDSIRIFSQLFLLEPGDSLQSVFDMDHFHPRHVCLTIRYTDFWWWENNQPLAVSGRWIGRVRLPDSVASFTMEFESLQRRKGEVEYLAEQAVEKWFLQRKDGRVLIADRRDTRMFKWTGSSMLKGERWLRDEVRPSELDYHVVRVTWRVKSGGYSCAGDGAECPKIAVPADFPRPAPPFTLVPFLYSDELQAAGVSPETPAKEALQAVQEYHSLQAQNRERHDSHLRDRLRTLRMR